MKMTEMEFMFEDFMVYCFSKNLSEKTTRSYDQTLKLFFHYLKEVHDIDDPKEVRATHVRQYAQYLQERGKYTVVSNPRSKAQNFPENRPDYKKSVSVATINNYIRNIKVFFNWLEAEGEIRKNPVEKVSLIKSERRPKKGITEEELLRVIGQFDYTTFHGYRNQIITLLLQDTGMRIGECLLIEDKDIDFSHRAILLRNTKGKKERYVFFSETMRKKLKQYLKYKDNHKESEYLFPTNRGTLLSVTVYETQLREAGKRAGVKIHPHQIRNNFARQFLLNGGDIFTLSRILGHTNIRITEEAYLDLTNEELSEKYRKHSPLANWRNI